MLISKDKNILELNYPDTVVIDTAYGKRMCLIISKLVKYDDKYGYWVIHHSSCATGTFYELSKLKIFKVVDVYKNGMKINNANVLKNICHHYNSVGDDLKLIFYNFDYIY